MADYRVFRDIIAGRIQTVGIAGIVHNRARYSAEWDAYLQRFKTTVDGRQQIRGWWLERTQRRVAVTDIDALGAINWAHTFVVSGVMSFQDASDTDGDWGDLVDEVISVLTDLAEMPNTFPGAWQVEWPRLRIQEMRMLGSVLCHFAEIILVVHKQENIG